MSTDGEENARAELRLALAVFVASGASLLLLGLLLGALLPADPASAPPEIARSFLAGGGEGRDGLHPEPKERTLFVALTLAAPLLVLAWTRLLRGWRVRAPVVAVAALLGAAAAAITLGAVLPPVQAIVEWLPPSSTIGVLSAGLVAAIATRRLPERVIVSCTLVAFAAVSAACAVAIKRHGLTQLVDWAPDEIHLEAFVFAPAQSAGGKHCLVDYVPQYGCYGELLAPVLRALGSTLDALSGLMIVLTCAGLLALLAWCLRTLRAPLLAALGPCAVLAAWMIGATKIPADVPDVYYQYVPLRFVFPALSLLAGSAWRRPSARLASGLGAFGALALIWNADAGVPVVGSLLALIAYDVLPRRERPALSQTFARLLAFAAGVAAGLGAFAWIVHGASGAWPALRGLFTYSQIFYVAGVYMIRMPLAPSCWQVVAGVYLLLLIVAAVDEERGPRSRAALQLAVLGLGLFAYYGGRSHPGVLAAVSWPAWLAGPLVIDHVLSGTRSPRMASASVRAALAALAFVALAFSGVLGAEAANVAVSPAISSSPAIRQHIAFVARTSTPSSRLALLAPHQGVILLHARRAQSLRGPGLAELALVADLASIRAQLASGALELAYFDRELEVLRPDLFQTVAPLLASDFELRAVSPDGRLQLWRHRAPAVRAR